MFWKSREKIEEEKKIEAENEEKLREEEYKKRLETLNEHFSSIKNRLKNHSDQQLALECFVLGMNACLESGFVMGNKSCFIVEKFKIKEENE